MSRKKLLLGVLACFAVLCAVSIGNSLASAPLDHCDHCGGKMSETHRHSGTEVTVYYSCSCGSRKTCILRGWGGDEINFYPPEKALFLPHD